MKSAIVLLLLSLLTASAAPRRALIAVPGAPGEQAYGERFETIRQAWQNFAAKGDFDFTPVPAGDDTTDQKARLLEVLEQPPTGGDELWIVLFGHGSYDGRAAKFNLAGDDLDPQELAKALARFQRPLVLLNLFAASAPFLKPLSGPGRIVVTSTQTERERNYSRYAEQLAKVLEDPAADLDADGSVSLLEVLRLATSETRKSYEDEQRLISEHAMIDDTGDGKGAEIGEWNDAEIDKPADGLRAGRVYLRRSDSEAAFPAELRERRAEIESRIDELRRRKKELEEDDYYNALEKLMLEMAKLYREAERS